jgi:hypothetical protein
MAARIQPHSLFEMHSFFGAANGAATDLTTHDAWHSFLVEFHRDAAAAAAAASSLLCSCHDIQSITIDVSASLTHFTHTHIRFWSQVAILYLLTVCIFHHRTLRMQAVLDYNVFENINIGRLWGRCRNMREVRKLIHPCLKCRPILVRCPTMFAGTLLARRRSHHNCFLILTCSNACYIRRRTAYKLGCRLSKNSRHVRRALKCRHICLVVSRCDSETSPSRLLSTFTVVGGVEALMIIK